MSFLRKLAKGPSRSVDGEIQRLTETQSRADTAARPTSRVTSRRFVLVEAEIF